MPGFKVKAVYEYSSPHDDDLSFPNGQIITVTEEEDADWYVGEYVDDSGTKHEGLFPRNFVDKYEPEPPPRPNRASRHRPLEPSAAQPVPPAPEAPQPEPTAVQQEEPEASKPQPPPVQIPPAAQSQKSPLSPTSATSARSQDAAPEPTTAPRPAPAEPASAPAPAPATAPAPAPAAKKPPPPIAAKSNAFRDRIAAFNSPAAAPVQPFRSGGGPPSTFIKKPFVAPPPSRDAYVPPPREAPQVKTYRRDEDPEIAERQSQDQENAERAGLAGNASPTSNDGGEEEQPKVMSLKERIAFLQKQQQEDASRAAVVHKEKPKRPPVKKRTESHTGRAEEGDGTALNKVISGEPRERGSMDNTRPPPSSHGVMSPDEHAAPREFLSDANDADQSGAGETEDAEGTSTSVEDDDERTKPKAVPRAPAAPAKEPDVGDEQDVEEAEEDDEEDEMDAETRRKLELRARMAKISGGMNPFGAPLPGPAAAKKRTSEKKSTGDSQEYTMPQQRFAIPGMASVRSPEPEDKQLGVEKDDAESHPITQQHPADEVADVEDIMPQSVQRTPTAEQPPPVPSEKRTLPPPMPTSERPAPPPVPSASRPVPIPPVRSPSPGSDSGDEMTDARSPAALPPTKRTSYMPMDEPSLNLYEKRSVPPIPLASPTSPATSRPPPPPPPTAVPPSRQPTIESVSRKVDREGETDYEGDYDTDIASGATHKEALKSHTREASMDHSITADEAQARSPASPGAPPPLPPMVHRTAPPPPPQQPPSRPSMDAPRGAPPLPPVPPPARDHDEDDDDYDPFSYTRTPPLPSAQSKQTTVRAAPPVPSAPPPIPQSEAAESSEEDELYAAPPPRKSHDAPPPLPPQAPPHQHPPPPPPQLREPPPPPPPVERPAPPPPPAEPSQPRVSMGRKSLDVNRVVQGRTSMDQSRPSVSQEFIASDVDLGVSSHWWTQPNMPPPSLQGRKDILVEINESRSGNTVEKLVTALYLDYSQTIISARFEANDVSNVELEQNQEPPPARLRQDQLETAHDQFGARIAKDVESKQNTVVGDGTPHGLILELLRPYKDALRPVSTRAFGALVYANLANASTQQYDEIRPGDIISFRNTKFQGKHGSMHTKYAADVGKPDHVGVVVEWDGSKKKVRAWEQGRESKKVKPESFRMGDLRSGEVRVWRVMSRSWVGWN